MNTPKEPAEALKAFERCMNEELNTRWFVETYAHILRTALSAQAGWQSIESAPKDGTNILVYGPVLGVVVSWWQKISENDGYWNFDTSCNAGLLPTHWQPLPSPPAEGIK